MMTIKEEKEWFEERMNYVLRKLKDKTHEYDIEADVFMAYVVAKSAYKRIHKLNAEPRGGSMKTIIMIASLLLPQVAFADPWTGEREKASYVTYQTEGNPDRYASVGFKFSNGTLNGPGTMLEHINVGGVQTSFDIPTDNEVNLLAFSPSFRVPITHNTTLELEWTYLQQEYQYVGRLSGFQGKVSGEVYTIGMRYYFKD